MGGYSSDSDDDRRGRSQRSSDSRERKKLKKSHKHHHSSRDSYTKKENKSRSNSNAHDSDRKESDRRHHRSSHRRRSRSRSYDSSSRDHSKVSDKSSRTSRSAKKHKSSRSSSDDRYESNHQRERSYDSDSRESSSNISHNERGHRVIAENADAAEKKLQIALRVAAENDESLRTRHIQSSRYSSTSVSEQQKNASLIESIEKDDFTQATFHSNRNDIPLPQGSSVDASHAGAMFSSTKSVAGKIELNGNSKATSRVIDSDTIMHPNLYIGIEEKMELWKRKLLAWRQRH